MVEVVNKVVASKSNFKPALIQVCDPKPTCQSHRQGQQQAVGAGCEWWCQRDDGWSHLWFPHQISSVVRDDDDVDTAGTLLTPTFTRSC